MTLGRMSRWLAIAAYQCQVDGTPTGSIDVQVRYFLLETPEDVEQALYAELPNSYRNQLGQTVSWHLQKVVAVQGLTSLRDGDEVIGFITDMDEFSSWAGRLA